MSRPNWFRKSDDEIRAEFSVQGNAGSYGGFESAAAKQQNRTLRNTIDTRASLSGVSWKQSENAYKAKFKKKANLTNNQTLQWLYDYMGSSGAKAKAPAAAPPKPLAAISNPSNTTAAGKQYQSQIAALTASLKAQQQQATAAQQKQAAAAQKTYQSQISEMQGLFASDLQKSKDQFGLQIKGLETGYGNQIAGLQGTISDNAAAYQQNIADQAAQFKIQQQTMLTNQERARQAGATPQLRLQEAQDMKQAGTKNFKKRFGSQFNPSAYGSLASIKSGTLNI